ncbi:hypothetical protein [Pseudonocardia humida]|uniref:Guanylate cyclase domain-containing protein n=1 Tax=Pseudonocardia humida TaxID=2800819 RepID=A0ABT1A326_9PSEU|nr:hypothetical protein [Pseudonocardia humida]MCO1657348.1 hypothetical protein [Pseudonocardia humida]
MKDFSGFEAAAHAEVTGRIKPIMAATFRRCGLGEVWDDELWHRVIGDAYVSAYPSPALPLLVHPLLDALQTQLEHENRTAPVGHPPRPLRMRASIHVGPITDPEDDPVTDGSGTSRVDTHRLLDSTEVKQALARAGEKTCVAAIVSDRAFTDAVLGGYCELSRELFTPVDVAVKNYRERAWLAVPVPSGDLLARGIEPLTAEDPSGGEVGAEGNTRQGDAGKKSAQDVGMTGIGSVGGDATNTFVGNSGRISISGNPAPSPRPRKRRDDS